MLAQTVTMEKGGKYDRPRIARAATFGAFILGPLAHTHFNFIEWLIVKKVSLLESVVFIYYFFIGYFSAFFRRYEDGTVEDVY